MTKKITTVPDNATPDKLQKRVLSAIDEAEAYAKDAIEDAEWTAKAKIYTLGNVYRKVTDLIHDAGDRVKDVAHQVEVVTTERKSQLEKTIKARPLTSVAIAVGTGMLLSSLLRSRSKD